MNPKKFILILILLGPALAFAAQPTPSLDDRMSAAAAKLEKAEAGVQSLKDAWDRTRLETTLYEQRAKRAYQRWVKAKKADRTEAGDRKDRAELEFELSVEKRKLAFNEWQAAQLRRRSVEDGVKALDAEKDGLAVRERIRRLEDQLNPRHPGNG